jgi:hypothetical protein
MFSSRKRTRRATGVEATSRGITTKPNRPCCCARIALTFYPCTIHDGLSADMPYAKRIGARIVPWRGRPGARRTDRFEIERKFFVPPICFGETSNSVVPSLDWLSTMTPGFRSLPFARIFARVAVRVPDAESETGLTKVRRRACYGIRFAPVAADEYRFFKLVFAITQS